MSNFIELAKERAAIFLGQEELAKKLKEIEVELAKQLGNTLLAEREPIEVKQVTKVKQKRIKENSDKRPTMQALVQEILNSKPTGQTLGDIVAEVTQKIKSKQYITKSSKPCSPLVSQALVQLNKAKLVHVKKSENNRNIYSSVA